MKMYLVLEKYWRFVNIFEANLNDASLHKSWTDVARLCGDGDVGRLRIGGRGVNRAKQATGSQGPCVLVGRC